jgi:hypothetical protein
MCMCDATIRMYPYSLDLGTFTPNGAANGVSSLAAYLTPCGDELVTVGDTVGNFEDD